MGGAAAILSACCVAPWVVTLLGAAGVATLMRLGFLQPWLLVGAALMLVGLFWLAYRPLPAGEAGNGETTRKGLRRIAWAAAAFVAIVALMVVATGPA